MDIVYTVGGSGNQASVERRGPNDYVVHYCGRQVDRKFSSEAGGRGFARHLAIQGNNQDPFGVIARLVFIDPLLPFADPHVTLQDQLVIDLRRVVDHLATWADDHAAEATAETWAALHCARETLKRAEAGHG